MYELEALTAAELRRLIDSGVSVAVVPFGSIEHQGPHLPLGADAILADAVGWQVAERLDAVLAPAVQIGCAEQHQHLLGTITLYAQTLTDVAIQLAGSLVRHGFTVIALISTHGGNQAALDAAVARLNASLDGAVACAPRGTVGPEPGRHSGQWLTSVMLTLRPDLVELDRAPRELAEELHAASAERGAGHVERFVDSVVEAVRATIAALARTGV